MKVDAVSFLSAFLGLGDRFRFFLRFITQTIAELNLFMPKVSSQDPKIIRRNRCTTRAYLISVITALFIILIYTSLTKDTVTVNVHTPSLSKYTQLYAQYSTTLKCPCTHIAIKYEKFFLQIQPQHHQICSSVFVSSEWLESMQIQDVAAQYFAYENDFRVSIQTQFLTLSRFCALSKKTIDSSLSSFRQTDYVTASAISLTEFNVQMEIFIDQFKRTIIDQFLQALQIILATNSANQLATIFPSNWDFAFNYQQGFSSSDPSVLPALTRAKTYGNENCSCAMQANCTKLNGFPLPVANGSLRHIVSGFRIGCYPLNAFLQSTLFCLYHQSCLDTMRASMFYAKLIPALPLTYSSSIEPNMTIQTILDQLFVSQWSYKSSFNRYFDECAPQFCQYSYSIQFNRVYIITTFIALIGGLTKGLHFLLSCAALVWYAVYDQLKTRNQISGTKERLEKSYVSMIDLQKNALEANSTSTIITNPVSSCPGHTSLRSVLKRQSSPESINPPTEL